MCKYFEYTPDLSAAVVVFWQVQLHLRHIQQNQNNDTCIEKYTVSKKHCCPITGVN